MLVSETHGFLFVKVQKTAGTSISRFLEPYALRPRADRWTRLRSDLGLVTDWRRRYLRPHAPLRHAERVIPNAVYRQLFKIAFVRNPWERLVSWYAFILQDPTHHRHRQVRALPSFEAFARQEIEKPHRSQWSMLANGDGSLGIDFVGRFETLQQDMQAVCARLGIPNGALPRLKVSEHRPYQSYYSVELAEEVGERWSREIDEFGYYFDGKPARAPLRQAWPSAAGAGHPVAGHSPNR